jgi:hypothetical protein
MSSPNPTLKETTMTRTNDELAAEALARVFLVAQRSVDAGMPAHVAIRAHIATLKDERPEVYGLIVRHAARQLVTTLSVVDVEAGRELP